MNKDESIMIQPDLLDFEKTSNLEHSEDKLPRIRKNRVTYVGAFSPRHERSQSLKPSGMSDIFDKSSG
jgi:hypothetical protein